MMVSWSCGVGQIFRCLGCRLVDIRTAHCCSGGYLAQIFRWMSSVTRIFIWMGGVAQILRWIEDVAQIFGWMVGVLQMFR